MTEQRSIDLINEILWPRACSKDLSANGSNPSTFESHVDSNMASPSPTDVLAPQGHMLLGGQNGGREGAKIIFYPPWNSSRGQDGLENSLLYRDDLRGFYPCVKIEISSNGENAESEYQVSMRHTQECDRYVNHVERILSMAAGADHTFARRRNLDTESTVFISAKVTREDIYLFLYSPCSIQRCGTIGYRYSCHGTDSGLTMESFYEDFRKVKEWADSWSNVISEAFQIIEKASSAH